MMFTQSPRMVIQSVLFLGILFFSAVFLGALFWFALPEPEYIEIGRLSEYTPAPDPYIFRGEISLFIINDGESILALDREAENLKGIPITVNWISTENSIINPLGGTHYDLYGCPFWWALNFETVPPMIRYPVEVQGDRIRIEVSDSTPACIDPFNTLMLHQR